MQDRADAATDKIERRLNGRLSSIYEDALEEALKNHKAFLKKIKDLEDGKIKPPASIADDPEKVAKWKQGFYRELIRREKVAESIADRLAQAGEQAGEEIRENMKDVYATNSEYVHSIVEDADVGVSFASVDKRQLDVIMQKNESPFSKIAYKNLGKSQKIREALQRELGIATLNGESQREIIARIRKVAGMSTKRARRIAQTERTRVQSQARWQAGEEAKAKGVEIVNEWSTRMINSRDTHIELNGKKAPQGERFPGSVLRFPGDPEGPAHEVINCHCVLIPEVLLAERKTKKQAVTETFIPAKTISEAEAFARTFISETRYSKGDEINYNGIDIEYANEMNRAFSDVFSRFDPATKFKSIQPFNKRKKEFKDTTAEAAYRWGTNEMFFNKDYYKSSKAFSAHVKQYEELMEYVMPHLDKVIEETSAQSGYIAKTKLAYYKALKKTERSNVMPPSAYNSTIHELGHFLDDTVFGKKYRADKFDMAQSYAEYAGGLSAYATANRQEYVAESFTAWWFGETDKIDPKLVKYFEESVKDGQSNHL